MQSKYGINFSGRKTEDKQRQILLHYLNFQLEVKVQRKQGDSIIISTESHIIQEVDIQVLRVLL